jgi:hypothetical protein
MCTDTKYVLRYFHDRNQLKHCKFNEFASYSFFAIITNDLRVLAYQMCENVSVSKKLLDFGM